MKLIDEMISDDPVILKRIAELILERASVLTQPEDVITHKTETGEIRMGVLPSPEPDEGEVMMDTKFPTGSIDALSLDAKERRFMVAPDTPPEPVDNPFAKPTQDESKRTFGPLEVPGVELDAAGEPWNADLHSSAKTKTAKKLWRTRKNIVKKPVSLTSPQPSQPVKTAVTETSYVPASVVESAGDSDEERFPNEPVAIAPITYMELFNKCMIRTRQQPSYADEQTTCLMSFKIPDGLMGLAKSPHLVPQVDEALEKIWNNYTQS